ncbi:hypothetical protein AMJ80_05460 [bacterium SM23_31]|nr:MAG: hypothetical protein AMJ80_05460 [bacterium SM23_31]
MRNIKHLLQAFLFLTLLLCGALYVYAQDTTAFVPRGIVLGDGWNSETKELETVFPDQKTLELGESGIRAVQIWTEIINCSGKTITWVIEYANGMRQEVWDQPIRYDRFRTYIKKTFNRKLWDVSLEQLVDVTGTCKIMLVDKQDNNKILASKAVILK